VVKTFASVGMSCQVAHQLGRFCSENPQQTVHCKSPFDWLICPPEAAISWLNSGLEDFKCEEITIEREHAFWAKHGIWFWHWFYKKGSNPKELDIQGQFERELEKLYSLRNRFSQIDSENSTFLWANTQNNLETEVFSSDEKHLFHADLQTMDRLKTALSNYLGKDVSIEICLSQTRLATDHEKSPHLTILPTEMSQWKGCDEDWNNTLNSLL